ncbi:hypothetical protein P8452_62027 [Trifolium repens]|nr:hypothetical protein P8452_62027 [Trifolium repens]
MEVSISTAMNQNGSFNFNRNGTFRIDLNLASSVAIMLNFLHSLIESRNPKLHLRSHMNVATEPEGPKESRNGFASQLHFLVDTLQMSFKAHFIKYFVTAAENPSSYNLKSSTVVPSPTVRDRVLKELFIEVTSDIWSTNLPHGQGTGVLGYQRVK